MGIFRKQTTCYVLNGKRVATKTKGAKKRTVESKRWYGRIRTADGKRKQIPLTEDEDTSTKLLVKLQHEQDERRINGTTTFDDAKILTLSKVLDAYVDYLTSKGNSAEYLKTTRQRLEKLFKALRATTIADLDSTRILKLLSDWRSRKKNSISIGTSNHYIVAVKSVSKWLQRERMTTDDTLIALRKMNSQTDRRRVRRAFTLEEFNTLCRITLEKRKCYLGSDWHFNADARVMLYRLAAFTGLRANELASLTTNSFDFTAKTFTLEAKFAKNRKRTVLPLHASLCEALPVFIAKLKPCAERHKAAKRDAVEANANAVENVETVESATHYPLPVTRATNTNAKAIEKKSSSLLSSLGLSHVKLFAGSWTKRRLAGQFLKRDLKRCGIESEDVHGSVLDFHSLRYTFITMLARAGVHPSKAQRLARHSSIHLTMNVYTMLDSDDLRDAVDSLPVL